MPKPRSLRSMTIATNVPSKHGAGPPSPTFSDATNASAINFGDRTPAKIITRADLKASMQAYENLLNTCAAYEAALHTMARATAAFADAMQTCASLKGPTYEQATRLQAASGLHHLMGNHWVVLAGTLEANFEKPLRQHLDIYRTIAHERSAAYERVLREKSNIIRDLEKRNFNIKRGERNMQMFREALSTLQRQIESLDELKVQHYEEISEHEEEVWDVVQGKVCLLVRSTMDVLDRFTAKSSDPILEPMLQSVPDPFDAYGTPDDDQIFSILPPLSIGAPSPSPSPSHVQQLVSTPSYTSLSDALTVTGTWTAAQADVQYAAGPEPSTEWADATSPPHSPPPPPLPQQQAPQPARSPSPSRRPHQRASSPRAESKLRSVLAVIDESVRSRGAGDTTAEQDSKTSVSASESERAGGGWATFPFAEHPRGASSAESTPRNSTFFTVGEAGGGEDDRGGGEEQERSRTPTATPPPVPVAS